MYKLRRPAPILTGQLTLTEAFDRQDKNYGRMLAEFEQLIKLIKYYRVRTEFSSHPDKEPLTKGWNIILQDLADGAFEEALYSKETRHHSRTYWMNISRDGTYVSMNWSPTKEEVEQDIKDAHKNLKLFRHRYKMLHAEPSINDSINAIQTYIRKGPLRPQP